MDTIRISLLHSKYPISYNKKYISHFFYYRSKVNTSLKNKFYFENIYFPSKFIKLCPESLKEHTDKISLRSDETQTFYWSFKYMSNYHLKLSEIFTSHGRRTFLDHLVNVVQRIPPRDRLNHRLGVGWTSSQWTRYIVSYGNNEELQPKAFCMTIY